jgi:hypothetical protein
VKFPGPTRQFRKSDCVSAVSALPPLATELRTSLEVRFVHFRTLQMMLRRTRLSSQVDTRFSRAAGGVPFLAFQGSNRRHHRRDMEFMFHAARAPMKLGYTQLAYQSRDFALAGLLFSQRVVA